MTDSKNECIDNRQKRDPQGEVDITGTRWLAEIMAQEVKELLIGTCNIDGTRTGTKSGRIPQEDVSLTIWQDGAVLRKTGDSGKASKFAADGVTIIQKSWGPTQADNFTQTFWQNNATRIDFTNGAGLAMHFHASGNLVFDISCSTLFLSCKQYCCATGAVPYWRAFIARQSKLPTLALTRD